MSQSELKLARARIAELEREVDFLRTQGRTKDYVITCFAALQRGEQPPPIPDWLLTPTPPSANTRGGEA